MVIKTRKLSVDKLLEVFQFAEHSSLSEAIIMSAISLSKYSRYLPIKDYRDNAFSALWKKQFHHGAHWTAQYRSELNQGEGRLAFRVFESPNGKGFNYRFKKEDEISKPDKAIINRLERIVTDIESGVSTISEDEETFQGAVQISGNINIPSGKIERSEKRAGSRSNQYPRKPRHAKKAIVNAKYLCEINNAHITFINPATQKNYTEAHHLIPMQYQSEYIYSIDVPENIISLCPNCHRKIHKALSELKKDMLQAILTKQKEKDLQKREINITLPKLFEYYK
ncbi:MAG: hypothetical protein GY858_08780 [Candidatus Omnitrophica bacterium]|nr:hypothetical protein [Candidatus Omnitrophota bacterium]